MSNATITPGQRAALIAKAKSAANYMAELADAYLPDDHSQMNLAGSPKDEHAAAYAELAEVLAALAQDAPPAKSEHDAVVAMLWQTLIADTNGAPGINIVQFEQCFADAISRHGPLTWPAHNPKHWGIDPRWYLKRSMDHDRKGEQVKRWADYAIYLHMLKLYPPVSSETADPPAPIRLKSNATVWFDMKLTAPPTGLYGPKPDAQPDAPAEPQPAQGEPGFKRGDVVVTPKGKLAVFLDYVTPTAGKHKGKRCGQYKTYPMWCQSCPAAHLRHFNPETFTGTAAATGGAE